MKIRVLVAAVFVLAVSACTTTTENSRAMMKVDGAEAAQADSGLSGSNAAKCNKAALSGTKPVVSALCN